MIIRWNPYQEFRRLHRLQQDMNHLFETHLDKEGQTSIPTCDWQPPVDVYEDTERYVLVAEVPGVDPSKVDVRIEHNQLTLRGERTLENEDKKENYLRVERCYGTFVRTFTLPDSVDSTKIVAEYKNGLLNVSVPKRSEVMPKQIQIKVSE